MMEAGMSNDVAVSQMEGAWYQVEASVQDIRKAIVELEDSLCTTLCMAPRAIDRGKLEDASFPAVLQTGVPAALLSRPIFNASAIRGKAQIAKADQEVAMLAFQQTVLEAGAEVNNALTQYQTVLAKEEWRGRQN